MLGAVTSHTLVSFLVKIFGWQKAVFFVATLGFIIGIILWFIVREPKSIIKRTSTANISILESLKIVIKQKQNWFCGFFICFMNVPLAIFGALYGISYLSDVYGITSVRAASYTSMMFIGFLIGSPTLGAIFSIVKKKKNLMFFLSFLALFSTSALIYINSSISIVLYALFFSIGFFSSTQVLAYPIITKSNPLYVTGSALSLSAFIILFFGYGVTLPVIGKLLDVFSNGDFINGIYKYSATSYKKTFIILPFFEVLAIVMLFFIKLNPNQVESK